MQSSADTDRRGGKDRLKSRETALFTNASVHKSTSNLRIVKPTGVMRTELANLKSHNRLLIHLSKCARSLPTDNELPEVGNLQQRRSFEKRKIRIWKYIYFAPQANFHNRLRRINRNTARGRHQTTSNKGDNFIWESCIGRLVLILVGI